MFGCYRRNWRKKNDEASLRKQKSVCCCPVMDQIWFLICSIYQEIHRLPEIFASETTFEFLTPECPFV
jgi:hypothetical protein